jgi:universal stress protein A
MPELSGAVIEEDRQYLSDFRRRSAEEARERLKAAIPETVAAYCQVETMVSTGNPRREILRIAAEQQADLIVVGVQGRSAADLLFFGSTTNHLVREATCPVLTIRRVSQVAHR